jgi:hypothetical protein
MEAGYLSPEEAVALRKGTAQSYVSQRGWRLADADPQQAVDTLSPTETSADGQPSFGKAGDWRDLIDPGERADMAQRSQQNLELQQRAAGSRRCASSANSRRRTPTPPRRSRRAT